MTLWGGRFKGILDPDVWELNASISFDRRLASQDVKGSIAWTAALEIAGILNTGEAEIIVRGLQSVASEFDTGVFALAESDEDIHTAVERRLKELVGPLAGKLHTGRSRNDQVATDFRLWLLDHLPRLDASLAGMQSVLVKRAGADMGVLMPGYTHLQRAQPVLLSHWWLSHFWPLMRDRERLVQLRERIAVLPLGSGALAGTPVEVDRAALAQALGFEQPSQNSIDAVSDRDFVAEFLFVAALTGVHLSKLAENIVLFSSVEFNFIELADAYTTGSSLMPQKKNPDPFELARGKAGTLLGHLTGLMAMLKGLPSAYDKDLQEDKVPVFSAYDTLMMLLPVLSKALSTLTVHADRMESAIDANMMATDLADYLVDKGVPFRDAHALVGKVVGLALERGQTLDKVPMETYKDIHPAFGPDVYAVFDPQQSVARRKTMGGTAPSAVAEQLLEARRAMVNLSL